jgi:hypothetical protein
MIIRLSSADSGDGLLAAAGSADGPGPQALLPRGGDGGRQVQGADAGVVGFEVLPEARDQGRGQLDEGVVVDAGLALAQVVREQVPDRPAGDAVPVDELLGGELPGELGADHPDGCRRGGREGPGGVQELVEERAGPPGAGAARGLPAAVQQLDAVAGGDIGDEAALGGHDHRDPLDRRVERGVPDGGLRAQLPQGRDPGGVPEPAHLVGDPGRGRRRQQPGKGRADDVAADQLGHARPEPGVQAGAQGAGPAGGPQACHHLVPPVDVQAAGPGAGGVPPLLPRRAGVQLQPVEDLQHGQLAPVPGTGVAEGERRGEQPARHREPVRGRLRPRFRDRPGREPLKHCRRLGAELPGSRPGGGRGGHQRPFPNSTSRLSGR